MFDSLAKRVCEIANIKPDKMAVAFKKEALSYNELSNRIKNGAAELLANGVKKGDTVLFTSLSKPEAVVSYLAIQYIGATAIHIDKNATAASIDFIYKDTKAVLLLSDHALNEYTEEINVYSQKLFYSNTEKIHNQIPDIATVDGDDIAEVIYTSGTTGVPKGAMLSYNAVYSILKNTIEGIGIKEEDIILIPLPLNHSFALRVLRAALYNMSSVVLQNGFTFAKEIENNLINYKCTGLAVVPASIETIRKQMQDKFPEIMGKFRYIEAGAGSLTIDQKKKLTEELPNTVIYNTWGSSESGGAIFLNVTNVANDENKISAIGKPIHDVLVKTVDENGKEFSSDKDHPGRMILKGQMQMSGYINRPEETEKALKDGWLVTGDMVYIEDGYVFMLGRADDIINVGGEKVSPVEVENTASQYEGIVECACIGAKDPEGILGFIPVLFVVPGNSYDEKELIKFLSMKLEKYKVPVFYKKVLEIPRNQMKKINRKALVEMWNSKEDTDLLNPVVQALFTRRSIRKFKEDDIPKNILDIIVKAGYYAPSGHNMQTWRFTVLTKADDIARIKEAAKQAAEQNNVNFYGFENPKVLILVSNDKRNPNGCQDASVAAENMMLAAHSYGLGSCWLNPLMTLRDVEPVKTTLDDWGIPKTHTVWSMIALGYPVADGVLLAKNEKVVKWI